MDRPRLSNFLADRAAAWLEPRRGSVVRAIGNATDLTRRFWQRRAGLDFWLDAAASAARAQDNENLLLCVGHVVRLAPKKPSALRKVTALLTARDLHDEATAVWRAAYRQAPKNMSLASGLLQAVEASGRRAQILEELLGIVSCMPELDKLATGQQKALVSIFRHFVTQPTRPGSRKLLDEIEQMLLSRNKDGALLCWILGSLDIARFDRAAALAHFDDGLAGPALPEVADFHAEKAALFSRYHLYGEALAELAQVPGNVLSSDTHYGKISARVQQAAEFCGSAPAPLRYPECLVDVIVEEVRRDALSYAPRPGHVTMVSGSLGPGGCERETVIVTRRMLADSRIEKLQLLIRSTHRRPNDDFLLPIVSQLPLDFSVYGIDWQKPSAVKDILPELRERPRLARAFDLLPQTMREDSIRLLRHFWDARPQAVHVWQDIPGAALACLVAGVPNFFVHRGSLSPDYWEQNEIQTEIHFRPMRHTYQRLLERPGFMILNNSAAGCRTDQAWTDWPKGDQFQVLPNAVDFSLLGTQVGPNPALRGSLGIPRDAFVVGGSFRIVSVKRPHYWIEAARQISDAILESHFIIIGDGELTDFVRERAKEYGIENRVHLPGRVSNVGDWYRIMDVSLLTSEREGVPNAIIEAQHFGVPIVATDVGGIRESIVPGKTGYVVSGESPQEYAERIIAILRDPAWRADAAECGPQFVHQRFSLDVVIDRLIGYYGIMPQADAGTAGHPSPRKTAI